jgi:hypothetical protein
LNDLICLTGVKQSSIDLTHGFLFKKTITITFSCEAGIDAVFCFCVSTLDFSLGFSNER